MRTLGQTRSVTLLSDIFPTGYFGADNAEIDPGDTVAVFGCGPVGQFAIASARLMDTGRVFAIDTIPSRLDRARGQGAECIDFNAEDPVQVLRELTGGPDPIVFLDAVGVDTVCPHHGPAAHKAQQQSKQFEEQVRELALQAKPMGDNWHPGDAPSQARNLTIKMGNCNHRRYIPLLINLMQSGMIDPSKILTQKQPFSSVIDA